MTPTEKAMREELVRLFDEVLARAEADANRSPWLMCILCALLILFSLFMLYLATVGETL